MVLNLQLFFAFIWTRFLCFSSLPTLTLGMWVRQNANKGIMVFNALFSTLFSIDANTKLLLGFFSFFFIPWSMLDSLVVNELFTNPWMDFQAVKEKTHQPHDRRLNQWTLFLNMFLGVGPFVLNNFILWFFFFFFSFLICCFLFILWC